MTSEIRTRPNDSGRCFGRGCGDAWGIFCTIVMYSTTLTVAFAVNFCAIPEFRHWRCVAILYNCIVMLQLASHLQCMWTNPGIAKDFLDQELQQQMREEYHRLRAAGLSEDAAAHCRESVKVCGARPRKWWCVQCDTFRPKRAHHCKTCRACVLDMDHHCPWVNNCVGRRNHKFFILFVGYAWLACIWSVTILTYAIRNNEETAWNPDFLGPANSRFSLRSCVAAQILCLGCAALSFVFAIFASVMGCDQWTFLIEGHGVVDQKLHKMGARHSPGNQRSVSRQLAEVLGAGEGLSFWWFLPFAEHPFAIFKSWTWLKAGLVNWHARTT